MMALSDASPFWARNFDPMQGRRSKRTGGVFKNTLRTFLAENAAAGQKSRPKQNSCEISGLIPHSFHGGLSEFQKRTSKMDLATSIFVAVPFGKPLNKTVSIG
jgi:hypothetical protein